MRKNKIFVHWFRFDARLASKQPALALLDEVERQQFRQFERREHALFFAFRRATRRVVLANYAGVRPNELQITNSFGEKPKLIYPNMDLEFSASHTSRSGVIAVSAGAPVGADVEVVRQIDTWPFSEKSFSPEERMEFLQVANKDRLAVVYRAWTAKESVIKGMGISLDFSVLPHVSSSLKLSPEKWRTVKLGAKLAASGTWYVNTRMLSELFLRPAVLSIAAPVRRQLEMVPADKLLSSYGLS